MKATLSLIVAATLGGIIGSAVTAQFTAVKAAVPPKLAVRELVLLNEDNKPVASLTSVKGRSVLSFFGQTGKGEADIGVDWQEDSRFLYFTGRSGLPTAILRSQSPHSEATLTLGDDSLTAKAILGALRTDMEPPPNTSPGSLFDEWGLQFRRFGRNSSVISVLVQPNGPDAKAGVRIERPDGTAWTAP